MNRNIPSPYEILSNGRKSARRERPVLVLSGGAVRGSAHLGFLAAMSEAGIVPGAIVGTSAGALMGALYISWDCNTGRARDRLRTIGYASLLRPAFSRGGLFSSAHLEDLIRSSLGKERFEELPVPLVAVATNLETRSLEGLDSGDLPSAIAASCALPPFFTPVVRQGNPYLDGGILSILPVLLARNLYPRETILAVDVNAFSPSRSRFPRKPPLQGENIFRLSLGALWLSIGRASRLESSFADHTVSIFGGNYPLFGLRSIERIYDLGYTTGMEFFGRREGEIRAGEDLHPADPPEKESTMESGNQGL